MAPTPVTPLSRWAATATIILTLLGWSSIPLFLKHFSGAIDPWTANGWRYAFSALHWAPVLHVGLFRRSLPPGLWRAAIIPSVFNALGQTLFGLAPYYIDPGLMTFSLRLQIIFVTVGAALFFPTERALLRQPAFLIGLIVVFAATLFTIASKQEPVSMPILGKGSVVDSHNVLIGVLCAVGSGFFYAAYSLSVRKWMTGMPAFTAFAAVSQYTALALLIPMVLFATNHDGIKDHGLQALDLSREQFLLLILSSVIGIGLGHTMYFFSLARLGLAVSAGVVQLQPIIVSIFSIYIFGELLTRNQWIGGAIAIAGALWMLAFQHRFAARRAP